ncbi:hypothetical protein D9758_017357 [Tetrapyrgos nigripes]|uniref:Palmitoyltransferase n=1 Tax=Tetrapyrgos nigripes TaxID=182062 RepID=A0A8H5C536_9AGAR|nr:hypothetical protein D9758_017357 [Tetrapyrgos nigripes]
MRNTTSLTAMKRDNYLVSHAIIHLSGDFEVPCIDEQIYGTFTNKSLEKRETDDDLSHSTQTLTPTTSTLVIIRDEDDDDDDFPFFLIPPTAAAETKMFCQKQVIGCFKTLEKWGDRLTGAAGPFFVTFAIVLISMGALSFYAEPMQPATTFPQSWTWARPRKAKSRAANGYRPLETVDAEEGSLEEAEVDEWNITKADMTKCRKCTAMRPENLGLTTFPSLLPTERAHHWVNQCVGIYNERHFILFMAYLWLSTVLFVLLGYPLFFEALGLRVEPPFPSHLPPILFILSFILSAVLSFAVGVMLIVALWAVMRGETSVEAQDNEVYRKVALSRGEMFGNGYDLGR